MVKQLLGTVCLLSAATIAVNGALLAAPPTIAMARIDSPPIIDGRLNDACWQVSPTVGNFLRLGTHEPDNNTVAWLGCDERQLFLAVRCLDSNAASIAQKVFERDGALSADETVEVFIDPGTGGRAFFQLIVSSSNIQADQAMIGGQRQRDWDAIWRSATTIDAQGWTVELGIPYTSLLQYGISGRPWRLCVGRGKKTLPAAFTSCVPLETRFNEYEKFAVLSGVPPMRPLFVPRIISAADGGYEADGAGTFYTLRARIGNESGVAGEGMLICNDTELRDNADAARANFRISGNEIIDVAVRVPVARPGERAVQLNLDVSGERRQTMVIEDTDQSLRPFHAEVALNYYTSEAAAKVLCRVTLPKPEYQQTVFSIETTTGPVSWRRTASVTGAETLLELPLVGLAAGSYPVTVALQKDGVDLARCKMEVIKRKPGAGSEVKIDHINQAVILNGKPFMPFALYHNGEMSMKEIAELGFNSIIAWKPRRESLTEMLDLAAAAGLYVVEYPINFNLKRVRVNDPGFRPQIADFLATTLPRMVDTLSEHHALLAYYSLDEPDANAPLLAGVGKSMADIVADFYSVLHIRDPYRPVFGLFSMALPREATWWRGFDFAGVDYYPSVGSDVGLASSPLLLAKGTSDTMAIADLYRVPAWITLNAETYSGSHRPLSVSEQRCQTYLAMIYRAKGLSYFIGPLRHAESKRILRQLAGEVKSLAPALLNREPSQVVEVFPSTARDPYSYPPIHARFKRHPDGSLVLLVANSQPAPVAVTYDIAGAQTAREVFGKTTRVLSQGRFTDLIGSYDTRAFLVEGLAADQVPRLALQVSGPGVDRLAALKSGDTSTVSADALVRGKGPTRSQPKAVALSPSMANSRNLVLNSSFEFSALPGWPDHWNGPLTGGPTIGEEGAHWMQVADNAFHGKYCVRMTHPAGVWPDVTTRYMPSPHGIPVEVDTVYTLSCYLKADREKTRVRIRVSYLQPKGKSSGEFANVTLTKDWKRYTLTFTPINLAPSRKISLAFTTPDPGAVWIDAVQLEKGDKAGEYIPDVYENILRKQ